jgi:hypothetical protein
MLTLGELAEFLVADSDLKASGPLLIFHCDSHLYQA